MNKVSNLFNFGLAGSLLLFVAAINPSPVNATDCFVADKPDGAGTVSLADLKQAGSSDNLVAPGAFVDLDEVMGTTDEYPDVFIRGPEDLPADAPPIAGGGSLPHEPHVNGSDDHGVGSVFE